MAKVFTEAFQLDAYSQEVWKVPKRLYNFIFPIVKDHMPWSKVKSCLSLKA